MGIVRFAVRRLRNEEWFRFHTEFFHLADECGAETLNIDRLFPLYEVRYKEADQLLELLHKSFITTDSVSADRARDGVYVGLRDTAKSLQKALDPDKRSAAVKVFTVVDKYSSAARKGTQAAKTAAIDNLLQDLSTAQSGIDVSAEVQLLGLAEWVADLDTANTAYKQSISERAEEATTRPSAGRLAQVRVEVDHYYVNMINVIDALLITIGGGEEETTPDEPQGPTEDRDTTPSTPDEKVLHFVKALNFCIARYKSFLKARKTRAGKKEQEEEEDGPKEDI
ncbi:MAG: DUF6261 family protein [Tannerellaceae bacterium]|jgi:hypothetical protein|nr:DUF6261 family protein [Tannerellaceae bacterium]